MIVLLVVMLFATTDRLYALDTHINQSRSICDANNHDTKQSDATIDILNSISSVATQCSSQSGSVTPIMRTSTWHLRSISRHEIVLAAIRSIDSVVASSRHGLYNHKILFRTHPRLLYLNRESRLRI